MRGLLAGAADRAPTFHWHVDPDSGNDTTGDGSIDSPYATLSKAHTVASAGESIGILSGTTLRVPSHLDITKKLRLGRYGSGARPTISGGAVITGWSSAAVGSEILTNTSFDTDLTGWTLLFNNGHGTRDTGDSHTGAASYKDSIVSSTGEKLQQDHTLTNGTDYVLSFWYKISTTGKQAAAQIVNNSDTVFLHSDSTWGSNTVMILPNVTSWTQYTIAFPGPPSTENFHIRLTGYDGGTYDIWYDDISLKSGSGATGSYVADDPAVSATYSEQGETCFVTSKLSGTVTPLTRASDSLSLTSNQWYWAADRLWVRLAGDADPSGYEIEAATVQTLGVSGVSGMVFRDLNFSHANDNWLAGSQSPGLVVDNCSWSYMAYTRNAGCLSISDGSLVSDAPSRVTRCVVHDVQNDGFWSHNTKNVIFDHNTMTSVGALAGDLYSDCIQIEDYYASTPNSDGFWIHHNVFDMSDTLSPKGCIITNQDTSLGGSTSGIIEYNVCTGGNFGVALHSSNTIVRYNQFINQSSDYGGGVHVDGGSDTTDCTVIYNTITGSTRAGIIMQSTTGDRTGWVIDHNTITDCDWRSVHIETSGANAFDGSFQHNTINQSSDNSRILYVQAVSGTPIFDYNSYPSNYTGAYNVNGHSYDTLAAYQAGEGYDTHSTAA